MKFFDVGQEANGFIAIGQMATGFFALGQMATGFIAIGQLARGFIAIGMVTYGVVSIGMLGVGVGAMVGMIGAGGVRGGGLVVPLVPWRKPRPKYPSTTTIGALRPHGASGWVEVHLESDRDGNVSLRNEGVSITAQIETGLRGAARAAGLSGGVPALAMLTSNGDGTFVCQKLMHVAPKSGLGINLAIAPFQIIGLLALAIGFWPLVAMPIIEALFASQ